MKKKVISIAIVGMVLFAGVVGASIMNFIDEINNHKESEKNRLEALYNQKKQQYQNEITTELQRHVEKEKQRISSELDSYVDEAAREAVHGNIEKERRDITKAADDAIKELEKYVDNLE